MNNFLLFSSNLIISIRMSLSAMNDFGHCDGYLDSSDNWFSNGVCYPASSSIWGDSQMYECDDSNNLWLITYDSIDCSGNISNTFDYGEYSGAYCSSSSNIIYSDDCDYFYAMYYDYESDCDETGSTYRTTDEFIIGKCVNTSYSFSSTYYARSKYYTCSQDSYNVKTWTSSDSCVGDHDYQYTYDPQFDYDLYSIDVKFYCSSVGEYSECNENGAFSMNNKYVAVLISSLLAVFYNQI